jgi:tRNA(fMet)-specific endonuclease VapC
VKYLLDTDHASILQHRSGPEWVALSNRLSLLAPDELAFSIVGFHEQVIGAHAYLNRARKPNELIRGYQLLEDILRGCLVAPILPFDVAAIAVYGQLISSRLRVASMDLRIAAIALSHNLILLTRNSKDFSRIPNLVIEDWTR